MIRITNAKQLNGLPDENQFIGELPELISSKIIIEGTGNILICEPSVKIWNSTIAFKGSNSIIYLSQNRHVYHLDAHVHNNCVLYMGKDNFMNRNKNTGALTIILAEHKHCFIGNDCMFSLGIWIRTGDGHLIYDANTNQRVNLSQSVFLGDHVWVGQDAMILKGSKIDSGSIIGAKSLVPGKCIPHNESWGGVPCRKVSDSIFWEISGTRKWTESQTEQSIDFEEYCKIRNVDVDAYKFEYEKDVCIPFEEIEKKLSAEDTMEIAEYLYCLSAETSKNRFVHDIQKRKKPEVI